MHIKLQHAAHWHTFASRPVLQMIIAPQKILMKFIHTVNYLSIHSIAMCTPHNLVLLNSSQLHCFSTTASCHVHSFFMLNKLLCDSLGYVQLLMYVTQVPSRCTVITYPYSYYVVSRLYSHYMLCCLVQSLYKANPSFLCHCLDLML